MKKFLKIMLCSMFIILIGSTVFAFTDVPETHWAYTEITELTQNKVINGYEDGTYKPNDNVTVGEFMKLLISASLAKNYEYGIVKTTFDHWAAPYIRVAETYNVVDLNSINLENIDKPITRIEMAKYLSLGDTSIRCQTKMLVNKLTFTDVEDLSAGDKGQLQHCYNRKFILGNPDNTFNPYSNLTRAEVAVIIYRYTKAPIY